MSVNLANCWINIGPKWRGFILISIGILTIMFMTPLVYKPFTIQDFHSAIGGASIGIGVFTMLIGLTATIIGLCYCCDPCRIQYGQSL